LARSTLDVPEFVRLLKLAAERKMLVQLVNRMEDHRTRHQLMQVEPVDLKPLAGVVVALPELRLQVLCSYYELADESVIALARSGHVSFDFSRVEGVGGVARLIDRVGADRVLFGSHFPLYHLESAVLKLKESDIKEPTLSAVQAGNARRLLS
jgi:hypothetical protein